MEYKDYYKILGVDKKATTAEINKQYRKLTPTAKQPRINSRTFRRPTKFCATTRNVQSMTSWAPTGSSSSMLIRASTFLNGRSRVAAGLIRVRLTMFLAILNSAISSTAFSEADSAAHVLADKVEHDRSVPA